MSPFFRWGIKTIDLSVTGIKNLPPLVGGIKGGGENSNKVLNFYFSTLSQPLPSRERSYIVP
jgi:hypothetical protein